MTSTQLLEIEFPVMRYDITMPLLEGRVAIDGVKLKPVKSSSMINKEDPKMIAGEFGLCDLNIGYWLPAIEAGWEIVGLPVFSKRKPVYQLIFTHADSHIRSPKDLEGKKIGSRTYRTALTVWARDSCGSVTVLIFQRSIGFFKPKKSFPSTTQLQGLNTSTTRKTWSNG
jgi:4,5-dihydroxyphthalate decarboxylase